MSTNTTARKSLFKKEALIHLDSLLRAANYMTGDESTSKNLVQETYMRAYCLWGNHNGASGFKTRLFRAMASLLYELYNLNKSNSVTVDQNRISDDEDFEPEFEMDSDGFDDLCNRVGGEMIRDSIRELPFQYRLILVLNFLERFSYQEIAEITGLNIGEAKSRLTEGRRYLLKILWEKIVSLGLVINPSAPN